MKRKGQDLDVVVVGAGPAGVGVGVILKHLGVERFALLERDRVGASFARWPEEMRFITPSFPGNGFGAMDLNAVALATSPAFTLGKEHPSGSEYAAFLEAVADHFELPVRTGVDVEAVEPHRRGFRLRTSQGEIRSGSWSGQPASSSIPASTALRGRRSACTAPRYPPGARARGRSVW
jgi:putative flavoprotein involved in K+ transport